MSEIPNDRQYAESHEWVQVEGDDVAVIGISDYAQSQLGDLVFVEMPVVGDSVHAGDEAGVVESVKTASDIYSPVSGEVLEVNQELMASPGLVNEDAYGRGWLFKVKMEDASQLDNLFDADTYKENIEE